MENFEKASRLKLRFISSKGLLMAEDLWDLSLTSLDTIAKAVNKELRDDGQESFIPTTSNKSSDNELRLEILKYVINVRIQEQEKKATRNARLAEIEQLEQMAERKATEALASQSLEDIQKKLAELKAAV